MPTQVPNFNLGNNIVSTAMYSTTVERDQETQLRSISTNEFFPNISYVQCSNPVASVKIDTSYISYVDGNIIYQIGTRTDTTCLYDILTFDSITNGIGVKPPELLPALISDPNIHILGVSVSFDKETRGNTMFVALHDIPVDGPYGYIDAFELGDAKKEICSIIEDMYLISHTEYISYNHTPNNTSTYSFYVECDNNDFYTYLYSCSYNYFNMTYVPMLNVVPIINTSPQNSNLHTETQRVVQYTGIMSSDAISTGKKSSYIDAGKNNSSYFYYLGNDNANYMQPSWKLNRSLNLNSTLGFYYDTTDTSYYAFPNPLNDFNGFYNTCYILQSYLSTCEFTKYINGEYLEPRGREPVSFQSSLSQFFSYTCENLYTVWDEQDIGTISINAKKLYIPSVGEFSFLMSRLAAINDVIIACGGDQIDPTKLYMTSNEASGNGIYAVWPFNGALLNVKKSETITIRPFIMILKS